MAEDHVSILTIIAGLTRIRITESTDVRSTVHYGIECMQSKHSTERRRNHLDNSKECSDVFIAGPASGSARKR